MTKLKEFATSVRGIKIILSTILLVVAIILVRFSIGGAIGVAIFIAGLWVDEIIDFGIKCVAKAKGENLEKEETTNG